MVDTHRRALIYNGRHFFSMMGNPQLILLPFIKLTTYYDFEFAHLSIIWAARWGSVGVQPMMAFSSYIRNFNRPKWWVDEA